MAGIRNTFIDQHIRDTCDGLDLTDDQVQALKNECFTWDGAVYVPAGEPEEFWDAVTLITTGEGETVLRAAQDRLHALEAQVARARVDRNRAVRLLRGSGQMSQYRIAQVLGVQQAAVAKM